VAATQDEDVALETGVSLTVNDTSVRATEGQLLIDACEQAGVYIPRFCYHPRMKPVGMCRMCLVEVDTGRGAALQPSCMVTVSEGMQVETESPVAKKAQEGVLEFLLLNHPLDCPVCDKGGECPLQDQTMAYGPGESRFVESKRHFAKPIPISPLVYLDRERCILCDRCTRFASEVAGDPLIHFIDRGSETQVNTFPDEPFSSYFSGNTVQICPVGALTAETYRFKARPWDLVEARSTFPNPMGDRIVVEASRDRVLRYQGWDSEAVNWGWLSDRDRFSFQACHSADRLVEPLVRAESGELVGTTWNAALGLAASAVGAAVESRGPESIVVVGGAHLTCEAQYLWGKLAKSVWGTGNVDAQLGDGLPAEFIAGLPRATVAEACAKGTTVVLLAADPKEELGTLYLRLRAQVEAGDVKLIELTPLTTGLSDVATHSLRVLPGDAPQVVATLLADDPMEFARAEGTPADGSIGATPVEAIVAARETLLAGGAGRSGAGVGEAQAPLVVIAGRNSLAESAQVNVYAVAQLLKAFPGAKVLPALRRGNIFGALAMGLSPVPLGGNEDGAGDSVGAGGNDGAGNGAKSSLNAKPALDTEGILTAAAQGDIAVLVCLGADPMADFPNKQLAEDALTSGATVICVDTLPNSTASEYARVVLPAAGFNEREGTHLNLEGRLSSVAKIVNPPGTARSDWVIAAELAHKCGADWGFTSPVEIWQEIAETLPQFEGITTQEISAAPDGILAASPPAPAQTQAFLGSLHQPEAVPHNRYTFRLVIHRTLYDNGTWVANCPSLAGLAEPSAARLNPAAMRELGIEAGAEIILSSEAGRVAITAKPDARVPAGVIAIAHNHTGADPRELIVSGAVATEVQVSVT